MGPRVKFVSAIIDAILKEMGANFFSGKKTITGGRGGGVLGGDGKRP